MGKNTLISRVKMQRIFFKNSRGKTLVDNLYQANSDAIILIHGYPGDESEEGRFNRLAASFQSGSFNIHAFYFSNHGENKDNPRPVNKWANDPSVALHPVNKQVYHQIGPFRYSPGGKITLERYPKHRDGGLVGTGNEQSSLPREKALHSRKTEGTPETGISDQQQGRWNPTNVHHFSSRKINRHIFPRFFLKLSALKRRQHSKKELFFWSTRSIDVTWLKTQILKTRTS